MSTKEQLAEWAGLAATLSVALAAHGSTRREEAALRAVALDAIPALLADVKRLERERDRLAEALRWYAEGGGGHVGWDAAREALKEVGLDT